MGTCWPSCMCVELLFPNASRFQKQISYQKRLIEECRRKESPEDGHLLKMNKENLDRILEQEERFWKQRAKNQWLQGGRQKHSVLPCQRKCDEEGK